MSRSLAAILCLSVVLGGCKAKELMDKASISQDLDKKGTVDLMKEAENDSYDPPADGKLTEAQVQMYLKVREQEKKIAQVAKEEAKQHAANAEKKGDKSLAGMMDAFKTMGSVADLMTADIRAAKQLGYNSAEYTWVKERVLAVSAAAVGEQMNQALLSNMDTAYAEAKKMHDQATDAETKKIYAEMMAGYEKTKQEMGAPQVDENEPGLAHNRQLLTKYESAMNAFAQELDKFTDDGQSAQRSLKDWEKQNAEAAKKQ